MGLGLLDLKITKGESIEFLFLFAAFMYITYVFRTPDTNNNEEHHSEINTIKTIIFLVIGLLALIIGSNYAVVNAEKIAVILKVPQVIIGLTIIAIGTSLPELAATISAIIKKKNDMVIGNVIGSNVMNIALVVPIIGLFSDTTFEASILSRDFLILAIVSVLFVLIAWGYWLAIVFSITAISTAFVGYLGSIIPQIRSSSLMQAFTSSALIWTFAAINIRSLNSGAKTQLVTVILKLTPLIVIIFLGFFDS